MLEQDDVEAIEREVRLWFKKRKIPPRAYMKLPLSDKVLLCGQVCGRTHADEWQLRDLYRKLLLFQMRGAKAYSTEVNLITDKTDEELREFFSPLSPSERLSYFEMF